jgi:hypothetical protein
MYEFAAGKGLPRTAGGGYKSRHKNAISSRDHNHGKKLNLTEAERLTAFQQLIQPHEKRDII